MISAARPRASGESSQTWWKRRPGAYSEVSTIEVEQARDYLERSGMAVTTTPDGRYVVAGETADTLGAARLVLLGLRHLSAVRRQSRS